MVLLSADFITETQASIKSGRLLVTRRFSMSMHVLAPVPRGVFA